MAPWFWYAVVAAILYGAHQIFTRMASEHIGDGLGGFVVEATAALSILLYLCFHENVGRPVPRPSWPDPFLSAPRSTSAEADLLSAISCANARALSASLNVAASIRI